MLSKKEAKDIQSLGLKKNREESGLFVAEGPKIVSELLQHSSSSIVSIYAVDTWLSEHIDQIGNVAVLPVTESELQRISQLQTPNRVVAVCRQFVETPPEGNVFTLYLDRIQDPGNFGTIIRVADWFGVPHVVCSGGCADVYNSKVVQSTMGSIARVNVYYEKETNWLLQQTMTIYAATLHGRPLQAFEKTNTGVLLIGNESKGLSTSVLESATEQITIQRRGAAESLNAAVATGIILSHLLK
jgi:TrmH family RNA methyltransferase